MVNYDGPSFYKQDHPKVEPIKNKKKKASQSKYSLPKEVRTREDMQQDAHDYMETPSKTTKRFRSPKFPASVQYLTDFEKSKKNHALIKEIAARLHKEEADYLLFDEYLADDSVDEESFVDDFVEYKEYSVEELLQKANQKSEPKPKPKSKPKPKPKSKPKPKTKSNAALLQEKMASGMHKPSSGLHRSLSKIIAEDQEALKNVKNHLGSLFSEDR